MLVEKEKEINGEGGREGEGTSSLVSLLLRTLISTRGLHFHDSSESDYLPKASYPNTIMLGLGHKHINLEGTANESIARPLNIQRSNNSSENIFPGFRNSAVSSKLGI